MEDRIIEFFRESISTKESFIKTHAGQIKKVAFLIAERFKNGNKLILMGNGGSATDASHIAAEFVNRFKHDRSPLPAISISTDMAVLTSIGNDYDFNLIFKKQVEALSRDGDVIIAISTSGNSRNVIEAVKFAKCRGLTTVAFTGGNGGSLSSIVDYPFIVPSKNTPRIQEVHITLGHVICEIVEEIIFSRP